ncbi:MAG: hypothetical protein UT34_C0001G0380 [candidate division WS6 bacterium GW2011_GWF2_39_15]|uniref:DUF916 domain-containing protein n=1 Tax=candidate division WS6 bacterium GW2011_GWF2_39_15 TaxID=1619100 RepID=A0A0G0Q7C9_9BACT|nr:MAG: hypothetical protein UT34_C0001G0380 [candidate division WS6 bacterium GW2011_GWF2_39_15]
MKIATTKKIVYLAVSILSTVLFFSINKSAYALGEAGLSIGFAPTAVYLELEPGKTYKDKLTFWNLAPSTITYDVKIKGFKQIEDVPGTSRIQTDFEELNDPYSAAKWIKVDKESVQLHPNEYFILPYTIQVPEDVAAGEFHALVYLESQKPTNSSNTSSIALADLGSGPAFLITTSKDLVEEAEIEFFKPEQVFYEYPPVKLLTRYLNKGNTHITPAGDIIFYNFLGQEVDRIQFNQHKQSLLRSNAATYVNDWESDGLFLKNGKVAIGPIEAKLITTYRAKFPGFAPLSATTSFWILPWKIMLAILLAIGAIIYIITRKRVKKSSENPSTAYINNPYYDNSPHQNTANPN